MLVTCPGLNDLGELIIWNSARVREVSFLSEKVLIAQKMAKNVNLDNSKLQHNNNYGKKAARRIEDFYTVQSRDKHSTFPKAEL